MDLVLRLAPDRAEPLYAQIAAGVREAVAAGVLHPGQALPSTREMARTLGVARNMVIAAYAQLADEGYLNVRQAGRTQVSAALPDDGFPRPAPSVTARFDVPDTPALRYLAAAGPAPLPLRRCPSTSASASRRWTVFPPRGGRRRPAGPGLGRRRQARPVCSARTQPGPGRRAR